MKIFGLWKQALHQGKSAGAIFTDPSKSRSINSKTSNLWIL